MTKILLVEDDKSLREIYSVRLLAEGYTLISSGDGEEALAAAIGEKPDLIVSDVMMPKISGFEMLDLLRSNDSTKNIPVIMLTALSSEQQRERGNRLGADRYLIKSQVGIEDIVRTVHEVLHDDNQPRNLGQMQAALAQNRAQSNGSGFPASAAGPATSANPANANEPIMGNPSITSSNFSNATAPAEPGNYQSAFNPPAATNPARAASQPQPKLPDTPLHIPTRTVPQAGMPSSYNAAVQSVDNLERNNIRNANNVNNSQVGAIAPTPVKPFSQPQPPMPSPQAQAQVQPQPAMPIARTTVPAAVSQPQPSKAAATAAQPLSGQLPQPTATAPAMSPAAPMQQMMAPQAANYPVNQPMAPAQMAPQPSAMPPQPAISSATQSINQMPGSNGIAYSGAGGERIITPPPAGTVNDSPRINIDELLANTDSTTPSVDAGLFPGTGSQS